MASTKVPSELIANTAILGQHLHTTLGNTGVTANSSGLFIGQPVATSDTVQFQTVTGSHAGTIAAATTGTTQANTDNSAKMATTGFVTNKIQELIGGAPGTLDTLNELAAAINDDASYNSTLTTALALKATIASPTFAGSTRVNGDFTVGAATGEDKFVVAPQAAGSGTFVISYNDAGNAYEPLTIDFETLALRTSGTPRISIDSSGNISLAGNLATTGTVDGVDIAARDAVLTSTTTTAGAALPKAGGTLTGALTGTTAAFNSGGTNVVASFTSTDAIGAIQFVDANGNVEIGAVGNDFHIMNAGGAAKMIVQGGGNLLVGTTSKFNSYPARFITQSIATAATAVGGEACPILELVGNRNANAGNQNAMIQFWNKTSTATEVGRISSIQGTAVNSGALTFATYSAGTYDEALRIDQNGNVGIGTTTPGASLHIAATNNNNNGIMKLGARTWFSHTDEGQTHTFLANDYNDDAAQFGIRMKGVAESDEKFTILGTGNVGIGTDTPTEKLEVDGGIKISNSNSRLYFGTEGGTSYRALEGSTNGSLLQVGENYTDIALQGNVGIGVTAPSETLVVSGDALVTGQMYLGPNTVSRRPFAKTTNWGYSTGYRAVVLGSASTDYSTSISGAVTLSFNYDPSVNPNGAFSGNGNEIIFRNGTQFVTPNAANDSFNLRNLVLKDGDVLIGSATNLNVLSGTPKLQIGSGTGHASLQFYSGASSVNGIYFGDDSNANVNRYDGYIEYQHANRLIQFRASGHNPMAIKGNGPLLPAGDFAYHSTQEHYTNPSSPGSFSTATNTAYTSSTQYWPDQGEKLVCVINARAFTKYLHIKTNLTANNIMFYFRTKGYFYGIGMEEQLVGGYTYYSGSNMILSKDNKTVAGDTHSGDTYRATDGSLVLKMDINQTGYTEGKMLVFFGSHAPSTVSALTVTAVTQKDDGTNAF